MIKTTLRLSRFLLLFTLHLVAGVFLLAIALIVTMMWQFSKGPMDLTFAADYIKNAFMVEDQPVTIAFDQVVAEWPNFQSAPIINFTNFSINEGEEKKLQVDQASLQLAILPLLIGRIAPETVTLENPVIRMMRDQQGEFRLLLTDQRNDAPTKPEKADPATIQEIGESLFLGGKFPDRTFRLFSNLKSFHIRNAELVMEDYLSGATWIVPDISLYVIRNADSIDVALNYVAPGHKELSSLNARINRTDKVEGFEFSTDLRNVDLTLLARNFTALDVLQGQSMVLNGVVQGTLDQDWKLQTAIAAVRSEEGRIRLGSALDKAFLFKDLNINLVYDRAAQKLALNNTSMELNGTTVSITAERSVGADGKKYLPITLKVPELKLDQVRALWPEEYRTTNAGVWLTRDLSGATLRNINVTANVSESDPADFSGKNIEASFDYEDLTADYRAPLMPVTEGKGRVTIKDDVLDIHVDSGKVEALTATSGRILVTNLTSDLPGEVSIDVGLNGPISTVFEYIAREPISLGETVGIDPKQVSGQGDYTVNVSFPTIADVETKVEDVIVKVDATLRDTRLPGIVNGLDLTGGPLKLVVDAGAFTISGNGLLDGTPIDLVYSEYLDPSTAPYASDIRAKLVTTPKLREAFGINLTDFVEGDVPADVHYQEVKRGEVSVDVKMDLTPAKAFIEPFNFVKPVGSPGTVTGVAILKNDQIQEIKNLEVVMGNSKATGGALKFGAIGKEWDIKSGSFQSVVLGTDNLFNLKFTQPEYQKLKFVIKGSKVDGRSFISADQTPSPKTSTSWVSATIDADVMRTGDKPDQVILNPKISADVNPEGDITALDVEATIGKGPFKLSIKPGADKVMRLRMNAANAGATLHALDIYSDMRGGELLVDGTQTVGGKINDIKGRAMIKDFTIVDAPILAQLMNGLSLGGIDELVKGKGIAFSRLRMNYVWKEGKDGRVINITDGRTSGASIGLSFGGTINQTKGTMDVSGTFVPMSGVNKMVSSIPLVGQLLTGGKNGGIIAATYAIKGPSEDPRVFINPLSVLAPGFLRSILFEGGLDFGGDDSDEPAPASKPERKQYN